MASGKVTFGRAVYEARQRKEISLRKFAEMIGVSATFVSMIENNELPRTKGDDSLSIKEDTIAKIAEHLDLNFEELLILANKVPTDLLEIIQDRPEEMAVVLRTARKMSKSQLQDWINQKKKRG